MKDGGTERRAASVRTVIDVPDGLAALLAIQKQGKSRLIEDWTADHVGSARPAIDGPDELTALLTRKHQYLIQKHSEE